MKNRTELLETVSFLADFHRCCSESGVEQTEEESAEEEMTKLGEEYVRHNRELKHIRKYILKRNNKSKFERLYLECYEAFARQSAEVVEFLQRYPEQDGGYTTGVCHGDVNQHNILFTSDGTGPDPDGTCPCGSTDYGRG